MLGPGTSFCASPRSRNAHGHLTRAILCKIYREMPYAWTGDIVLCEPAQSKCTWTCHFMQKFSGNWPDTGDTTSIEHRALTLTTRTPSVWPHCLGKKTLILKVEDREKDMKGPVFDNRQGQRMVQEDAQG